MKHASQISTDATSRRMASLYRSPQGVGPIDGAGAHRHRSGPAITWSFAPATLQSGQFDSAMADDEPRATSLIVWIDENLSHECHDFRLATEDSDANFLHVIPSSGGSVAMLSEVLAELHAVVAALVETYSVSTSHVYLAGTGRGAAVAMRLLLLQPESFRGIAMFNPEVTSLRTLLSFDARLHKHRVLHVTSIPHPSKVHEALAFRELLQTTGMSITTNVSYPQFVRRKQMFQDISEWVARDRVLQGACAD